MTAPGPPDGLRPRATPFDHGGLEIPHPAPYLVDVAVQPEHLGDVVAHVSNVEYVRWLDRVAELHSDALGYTRERLLAEDRMWFVARHEIDYRAEVGADDRLVALTWVRDVRRVRSWRDTLIVRADDGAVVCRGATLWVLVDLATRRPVRIDDAMIRAYAPLTVAAPEGDDRTCASP